MPRRRLAFTANAGQPRATINAAWRRLLPGVGGAAVMNDRAVTLVSVVSLGPGDQSVEFHLSHGDMIRLLRGCGFEIEDLHETRPEPGAITRYPYVTLEWAPQWLCEEV